ncbi:S-protein-like 1, partial [Cucurbita argyrosperma subsp. sororia]
MGDLRMPLRNMIVATLALVAFSTVAMGSWPLETWTVQVVNGLGGGQTLLAHCKSKNDDMGDQNIATGALYSFTFKDNVWQTTEFWCTLTKPNNAHASFDVYWYDTSKDQWLYTRCGDHTCVWIGKDDGVYIKNASTNQDELVHPWE